MSGKHDPLTFDDLSGLDIQRRNLLKVTGAGVAALGALSIFNVPFAKAQDMSNGANNFYKSGRVTLEKVTFKTQFQTKVAGNLFIPNHLDPQGSPHFTR
jgi:uncharacterized protein